ncbi:MAG: hypothetical protein ACJAS1_006665 [Oleiphilaceae bacterium]|jgi:hypothetical protein
MDADKFINGINPLLNDLGFKKSNSTWRRDQSESIAVINIQKSQWSDGSFYINLGVFFSSLGNDTSPMENKCHVRVRMPVKDPLKTVSAANEWLEARALLKDAVKLAADDSKKGLVLKELRNATIT